MAVEKEEPPQAGTLELVSEALDMVTSLRAAAPVVIMFLFTLILCMVTPVPGVAIVPLVVLGTLVGIALGRGLEDHGRKRYEVEHRPQHRWAIAQAVRLQWERSQTLPPKTGQAIATRLESLWFAYEGGLIDSKGAYSELERTATDLVDAYASPPDTTGNLAETVSRGIERSSAGSPVNQAITMGQKDGTTVQPSLVNDDSDGEQGSGFLGQLASVAEPSGKTARQT